MIVGVQSSIVDLQSSIAGLQFSIVGVQSSIGGVQLSIAGLQFSIVGVQSSIVSVQLGKNGFICVLMAILGFYGEANGTAARAKAQTEEPIFVGYGAHSWQRQ